MHAHALHMIFLCIEVTQTIMILNGISLNLFRQKIRVNLVEPWLVTTGDKNSTTFLQTVKVIFFCQNIAMKTYVLSIIYGQLLHMKYVLVWKMRNNIRLYGYNWIWTNWEFQVIIIHNCCDTRIWTAYIYVWEVTWKSSSYICIFSWKNGWHSDFQRNFYLYKYLT